jgi:imidazolonepropionase-like amidohydrolase
MNIGVPILVGSDEVPHGRILSEMDAMMRHGMTPTEVIAAATSVGRRIMGLQLIEEGASADLVTWDADPRLDLSEIAKPKAILAAGRRVLTEEGANA